MNLELRTQHVAALVAAVMLLPAAAMAQGQRADYARAEQFLNDDVRKLAYDGQVDAHWMPGTSRFWYLKDAPEGKEFLVFDAASGTKSPAFDHARLAAAMTRVTSQRYDAKALPFNYVRFMDGGRIAVAIDQGGLTCDLGAYTCTRSADVDDEDEEVRGGPPRQPDVTRLPRTEKFSPDRKFVAFVREHNLWVRN